MHQSELAGSVGVQEKIKMTLLRRLQSFLNHLLNPISNFIWATFPILLPSNNSRYPNYSVATLVTHSVTSSHVPWVNLLCAYRPPTVSKRWFWLGSDLVEWLESGLKSEYRIIHSNPTSFMSAGMLTNIPDGKVAAFVLWLNDTRVSKTLLRFCPTNRNVTLQT